MKRLLSVMLMCLISVSPAGAEPEGYLDGTDWVGFSADYKLALVEATQEELRDLDMTAALSAEFYVEAVNKFYSDPDHLSISFADAMSIIGFPLGDFQAVKPAPVSPSDGLQLHTSRPIGMCEVVKLAPLGLPDQRTQRYA